jgi:hypothetical protein
VNKPNCCEIASGDGPDADLTPGERYAREEIDRCVTRNLRHHGIRTPERDRGSRGYKPAEKLNVDAAGWCRIGIVKVYIEGEGCADEYGYRSRAAERGGEHYNSCLVPYNHRNRDVNENDVMQVAIESAKDRYRRMAQVNTYAGVKIPCWISAKHGRSIKSVNPMHAGLRFICLPTSNALQLVGNVTHKTNAIAVKAIIQSGLRNDFNERGEQQGRTATWRRQGTHSHLDVPNGGACSASMMGEVLV